VKDSFIGLGSDSHANLAPKLNRGFAEPKRMLVDWLVRLLGSITLRRHFYGFLFGFLDFFSAMACIESPKKMGAERSKPECCLEYLVAFKLNA